ncbi:hypothetical protein LTR85_010798 [Meristemomyces frigidus]|nr:hypothetical protein LTR85_010798 [Meristemomyces frigidus]
MVIRPLSPFALTTEQFYLLQYFESSITPQCVLPGSENLYCKVLLRMCIAAEPGPVLHSILAVSANQLRLLGRNEYRIATWRSYSKALAGLSYKVQQCFDHGAEVCSEGWEDVLAASILLCFFEISFACSDTWLAHARCARTILQAVGSVRGMSVEKQELCKLAYSYFASHDVFARTASTLHYEPWRIIECPAYNASPINTLVGCSEELLGLISQTSDLADEKEGIEGAEEVSLASVGYRKTDFTGSADFARRRTAIERRLHSLSQIPLSGPNTDDIALIVETKRLAALIYLYGRFDCLLPHQAPIPHITRKLLSLLAHIESSTTVLLWPLFIVGTFGIQPEGDEDRKLVLKRLTAMQRVRQLAHVKKARRVIEAVWKARDLRAARDSRSWDLLREREGKISLT